MRRNGSEAMTAGPAHRRRMGVNVAAAAKLPDAGVGLEREFLRLLAERLQQAEQALVARPRQAAIEEHRHRGENDAAVGVVLGLLHGGIADAHRAVAAIALEARCDPFVERIGRHDAVDRAQLTLPDRGRDAEDERDEVFHRLRRAQAVERLDDEIGVAQPAEAVVPGARRAGRLGDRGRVRRDDAAGLLEIAQLERDRGADHRVLPIVGDREAADPVAPIVARAIEELAAGPRQFARERLVGAEHHVHRARERKRRLALDERERGIGGQAHDRAAAPIADVVAADRMLVDRVAVVVRRAETDGDAGKPGDRLDHAEQLRRPERAVEIAEAGREVGDAHRAALAVGQHRLHDRGVAHVFRLEVDHAVEHHVGESLLLVARDQAAEHRVGVEARIAPPHDPRTGFEEGGGASVADDGKVESKVGHGRSFA